MVFVIPATILAAWVFFWFCERPFMVKRKVGPQHAPEAPALTLLQQFHTEHSQTEPINAQTIETVVEV